MLAGNPLYCMVNKLMDPEILDIKKSGLKGSRGTAIIKEELFKVVQVYCLGNKMDPRANPDSVKDLTSLVDGRLMLSGLLMATKHRQGAT